MDPMRVATDFAGAWRRAGAALAWVGGVALQLQQSALWEGAAWPLLAGAALAAWLVARVARRRGGRGLACVLSGVALAVAGFGYAGWRAELRLADALAPAWEGCDIELVGTVDDMPQVAPDGEHFAFAVESARPLAMTPREIKRVRSLAEAAGQPWPATVAAAGTAGARAPVTDDDDDDEAIAPTPPVGAGSPQVPSRVWLQWNRNQRDDRSVAEAPPPLRAGQRWRLPVRLRRPHGAMNPDGFDAELWLFDQGLRATGAVRGNGLLLSASWSPIADARQWVRDRLLLAGSGSDPADAAAHGALAALAVGDQAAIDGAGWEVFRNTGVAHLMSISGLHITMLGWLGGAAVGALWRRSERAALLVPAPAAARWGGVGVAWLYALLAGWGVPAQRTVVMLAATAVLRGAGLDWPAALVALAAMLPVTLLDPWALLQPGFWLSFAAVGLLMVSAPARPIARGTAAGAPASTDPRRGGGEEGGPEGPRLATPQDRKRVVAAAQARDGRRGSDGERSLAGWEASAGFDVGGGGAWTALASLARRGLEADGPTPAAQRWRAARAAPARLAGVVRAGGALAGRIGTELRGGVRAQLVATIGLAPLTLVAFQQVSPAGLLANLVAEPWVTLVVTPLTLLGIVLPPLWTLAALALKPLLWWLAWLARWPLASVHVATAPIWSLAAGLAGGAVLMLPLPWRVRGLGLLMLPPLLWPFVQRPAEGRFELVAADVGQGTAVLVRTHGHLLLFDTGPRFGDDDAGHRLLLPLLQARGEPRIDILLLSHADADHVGGAQSLVDRLPVLALRSSLSPAHPLRANPIPHTRCVAGQAWDWDGVRFTVLHPFPGDYRPGAKTNALSCVLRVVGADGGSALLTGDVEAAGEARLVAQARAAPGDPAVRLRSDVLVVPHHGSRTSSTDAFLDAVRPGVAVIQVGYRSRYGHPAPDVVARYRAHGIPVVRSDHCGAWTWYDGRAGCTREARRRYWHWQGADTPSTPAWIGRPPPPGEP